MPKNGPDPKIAANALIENFHRDGVVLIEQAISEDWVQLLREAVDEAMASPSAVSREYASVGTGRFFTDHHMSRRIAGFRSFIRNSPASEIAARILRADRLNLVDEHLLVKEAMTDNPTYWHHDLPYYHISAEGFASMWISLDVATQRTGAMRFVLGSHRWGKVFQPIRIGTGEFAGAEDEFDGPVPHIDSDPASYDIKLYETNPGDILFFHSQTLHAAVSNFSADARRRALSLRFASEHAYHVPRAYVPSMPGQDTPVPGSALDQNLYPLVWNRSQDRPHE